jgi:5,10-methylene-tetrahydrofolate dehydrogenase/methenyl tetrahydrofolate cyclohydrolase
MLLRAARRPHKAIYSRYASSIAESSSKNSRTRAELVNGRAMAHEILAEVRREVELMASKRAGLVPGLATILVGERKDSAKYVDMKQAVAKSVGFHSLSTTLPVDATSDEVLAVIRQYNADDSCHGILLQLPVPAHLDARTLLGAIRVEKDVECFHPLNTGRLSCWRHTVIAPCTPRGIMEMLSRLEVSLPGKHAVVLGDSNVVGLPMVLMLNAARATVTMVHQYTVNPELLVREADIVVAACGVPELVKKVNVISLYSLPATATATATATRQRHEQGAC